MNNGQGAPTYPTMGLQLIPNNGLISLDQYQRNQEQIARAREALANLEEQSRDGYRRFVEQELWARVEAGRQAE